MPSSTPTSDGTVPTGVYIDSVTWNAAPGWGWAAHLLPFIEAANTHNQLDFDRPIWQTDHREIIQTQVPVFLCPSSSGDQLPFEVVDESRLPYSPSGNTPLMLGRSHYVASHGQESAWGSEAGADRTGIVFTDINTFATKKSLMTKKLSRPWPITC